MPVEDDAARRRIEQARHHHRRGRLAAAGFAHQAERLAAAERERDAVDRTERRHGFRLLAASQEFSEQPRRSLAWIFLDECLDRQQRRGLRLRFRRNRFGGGRPFWQQCPQRAAGTRRRTHKLARIGMRRGREDRGGGGGLDHMPLFHHHDLVAIGGGKAEVVGNQDGRHAPFARQFDDQVHHRLLRGHVEAGRRLVGDEQLRLAGERQRNDHTLAHAPGQLVRVGVVALLRPRDPDPGQRLDRLFLRVARIRLDMLQQHVLDLPADGADRIERGARILEDHRHLASTQRAHRAPRRIAQVDAREGNGSLRDLPGTVEDAHDGVGRHRLAGTRFADDADRLPLADIEIDRLDSADHALAGGEFDREVAHAEQRRAFRGCGHHRPLRCGAADRRGRADRRPAG